FDPLTQSTSHISKIYWTRINCYVCPNYTCLTNFYSFFFFFNDTATTEIYTLSLHDALPILTGFPGDELRRRRRARFRALGTLEPDRKSTRLNSSHRTISYAVFCLKKKN